MGRCDPASAVGGAVARKLSGGLGLSSNDVLGKVVHALSEVLGVDESEIDLDSKLTGDLDASSLDVVDLLFQMKKVFGIELTLAEVRKELVRASGGQEAAAAEEQDQPEYWDDALFENVAVRDVVSWVETRLPG
jgi:acyl carrier protein